MTDSVQGCDQEIAWRDWFIALLLGIGLSIVWYHNFELYQIDQGENLIFMKMFRDPELYPDVFLAKKMYSAAFYTFFSIPEAFLGLILDPYWVLFAYFVIINCLCVCGIFYLAHTVTKSRAAAFLAVCALTFQWQWSHALAGVAGLGIGPFPEQMATGLLLFAIALFLQKRYFGAYVLAGLVFNIHGSFAIFALVMFSIALLLRWRWKHMVSGCLIAFVAMLPLLIYMLYSPLPTDDTVSFASWYQLIRLRVANHTMPFLWGFGVYAKFLPYLLLLYVGYQIGVRNQACKDKSREMLLLSVGIGVLWAIGTIFAEIIPVEPVIKLTLFRSSLFIVIFAVILYVGAIDKILSVGKENALPHILLLSAIVTASFPILYIALLIVCLKIMMRRHYVACVALLTILSAMCYALFSYDLAAIYNRGNFIHFVGIFAVLIGYYHTMRNGWSVRPVRMAALIIGVTMTAILSPIYHAYLDLRYYEAVKEVQLWLREETPERMTVITPPDGGTWSGISERATVFTFIDLNQIYWPHLTKEVLSRANEYIDSILSFDNHQALLEALRVAYRSWDEKRMTEVADRYGSRYAVVSSDMHYTCPLAYENDYFRIYDVQACQILNDG